MGPNTSPSICTPPALEKDGELGKEKDYNERGKLEEVSKYGPQFEIHLIQPLPTFWDKFQNPENRTLSRVCCCLC